MTINASFLRHILKISEDKKMDELTPYFNEMPVFIVLAIAGYILRKIKILDSQVLNGFSGTLVYVALPSLLYVSFVKDINMDIFSDFTEAVILTGAVYIFLAGISTFVFRKKRTKEVQIVKLSIVFSNCAFVGIPIVSSLYGKEGIIYTSIFILFYNIFIWTYAIKVLNADKDSKGNTIKILKNPGVAAIIFGFLTALSGYEIPYVIIRPIEVLGGLTTPLAMIIVGALFAGKPFKRTFFDKYINLVSFTRLILIPAFLIFLFKALGFSGTHINVIVILSAMPVATAVAIFAEEFDATPVFAAGVVGHLTIISIITIPVFYYLLNVLF